MTADIRDTLAERNKTHGEYADQAALAAAIKRFMHDGRNWPLLSVVQSESLDMIAVKISRILTGDPYYADNWHDIAGYALLVSNSIDGA